MSKYYVWNASNTFSVFSSIAANKPFNYSTQNSQTDTNLSILQKDDCIILIKNETELFASLKITNKDSENISIIKEFENSKSIPTSQYELNVPTNNIKEISEDLYRKILNELQGNKNEEQIINPDKVCKKFIQTIYYGVPGCGKSYCIDSKLDELGITDKEFQTKRVVFHPEYTNSDFIGQIIPKVEGEKVIYEFKAGPFTEILKRAYLNKSKCFALIIEEINRGNAAAIFGELFQLLDRFEDDESETINNVKYDAGWSSYCINNDDMNAYIQKEYNDADSFIPKQNFTLNTGLRLPPNLSIFATMNTSDQNVFKLDNAFKRRWELEMIPNEFDFSCDDEEEQKKQLQQCNAQIEGFDFTWGAFRAAVNELITNPENEDDTSSFADRQIGTWFAKPNEDGIITTKVFANKVLEYLWDDVFTDNLEIIFNTDEYKTLAKIIKDIDSENPEKIFNSAFLILINQKKDELDILQETNYTRTKAQITPTIFEKYNSYITEVDKMVKSVAPSYNFKYTKHYIGMLKDGNTACDNFVFFKIKPNKKEFRFIFIFENSEENQNSLKEKFGSKITISLKSKNLIYCTLAIALDDDMQELKDNKEELTKLLKKSYDDYFKYN